jgi:hypothetical protein
MPENAIIHSPDQNKDSNMGKLERTSISRRQFLGTAGVYAAGLGLLSPPSEFFRGNKGGRQRSRSSMSYP